MPLDVVPVFVSSTSLDLGPERGVVRDAILRMKQTQFVGMEYFGSRDEDTRQASLDEVERTRVYVGIIAGRYGSGITEAEYERAGELGLPRFVYFKDDATVPAEWRESDPAQAARLDAFKQRLRATHLNAPDFINPQDLAAKLTADLHRWLFDQYLPTHLQRALSGEVPRDEAQALLKAVQDFGELSRDLLAQLKGRGFDLSVEGDFVARDKIVYEAAAPVIPALHQLRAPVGDFVGREKEIAELTAALRGGTSATITGISGMGGIGKTELSLYVAERLRDAYPDAQLVLDMRGTDDPPRDPSDALAACIRAFLGLEYKTPDSLDDLTHLYRSTLQGKRALILLDNARDSAQARPLLPPAGSALFITSRETIALPGMKRVTLDQLHPNEARELLTGIAARVPADAADQICFLCGYLPLAIRAAGSLLDVTVDLDASDYATQLNDERLRLERIGAEGVEVGVEASFNLSYARLSPDAARVFRQLAVFPATFDAAAEEAICKDPGHKHLTDLLRRNLVLYSPDTRRYRLHDLARLFAGSRLSDQERSTSQMRHAVHYLSVLWEINLLYRRGGEVLKRGLALLDAEWRNIEAGQMWTHKQSGEDDSAAKLCNEYPNAGGYPLMLRQHPREQIRWLEAALAAVRRLENRAAEGVCLADLAIAYGRLGEMRHTVKYGEQALVISREIGDRRGEASVLGNLGTAYVKLEGPRRALEFYEQTLAIAREIGDRRMEGNALVNIGSIYVEVDDIPQAINIQEQALAIMREVGDPYWEGIALSTLGIAYAKLGETRRAIEFFEQRLAIGREIGDLSGEGSALFNIAVAVDELGDRTKAIHHAEAALRVFERIESPDVAKVLAQLAKWRGEATGGE